MLQKIERCGGMRVKSALGQVGLCQVGLVLNSLLFSIIRMPAPFFYVFNCFILIFNKSLREKCLVVSISLVCQS